MDCFISLIPQFFFEPFMVEYVYKPSSAAFWVLVLGYLSVSMSNLKRKSHIKRFAKLLYVSHKEIIEQLNKNISDFDGKYYTLSFPELDKGSHLVKSIESLPQWAPFSNFTESTYYLVGAIDDYNTTRKAIVLTSMNEENKKKACKRALNFACNAYINMLSISDAYTFKENDIKRKASENTSYAMEYYGVNN